MAAASDGRSDCSIDTPGGRPPSGDSAPGSVANFNVSAKKPYSPVLSNTGRPAAADRCGTSSDMLIPPLEMS